MKCETLNLEPSTVDDTETEMTLSGLNASLLCRQA
jgi:hypothetical protein